MNNEKRNAPYNYNVATLPAEDIENAKNLDGKMERVDTIKAVVFSPSLRKKKQAGDYPRREDGFKTPVEVRFWMGRSSNASVVHCTIWVRTKSGRYLSGYGAASGWGYHKESAAFDSAVSNAGIELKTHCDGCGNEPMRIAIEAIVKACGYSSKTPLTIG